MELGKKEGGKREGGGRKGRKEGGREGRGKGKMLNAENLHVLGQAKMLSLGKEMSGELGLECG